MQASRKAIRNAIREHIKHALTEMHIYTRRYVDGTGHSDFVTIYFQSGDIQYEGIQTYTSATLSISLFGNLHSEDDDLDKYGDQIQQQLDRDTDLGGLVRGFQFSGFEYPMDDEPHFNQLVLNYTIQY